MSHGLAPGLIVGSRLRVGVAEGPRLAIRRDLGLCVPCLKQGRTTAFAQVDHVIPKSQGGTDDVENLQCICGDCHAFKTQGESRGKNIAPVGIDGWPIS